MSNVTQGVDTYLLNWYFRIQISLPAILGSRQAQ